MRTLRVGILWILVVGLAIGACSDSAGGGGGTLPQDTAGGDAAVDAAMDTATDGTLPSDTVGLDTVGDGTDEVALPDAEGDTAMPEGTIAAIQQLEAGLTCDGNLDPFDLDWTGTIEGAVVVSPPLSAGPGTLRVYLSDGTSDPYSGILMVYDESVTLAVGDVVDVEAQAKEYYCFTELVASSVTVVESGAALPTPPVVASEAIASEDGPDAEQYEGVVVTVEHATVTEYVPGQASFTVDGVLTVGTVFEPELILGEGCVLTSLTGAITYAYGTYRILPRSSDDVVIDQTVPCEVQEVPDTIEELQTVPDGIDCDDSQQFTNLFDEVTISGAIVMTEPLELSSSLHAYFLSEAASGPNTGIQMTVDAASDEGWPIGTIVTVTGELQEFYCNTQLKATTVTAEGTADTLPEPVVLTTTDIAMDAAATEPYEGSFVRVEDVEVTAVQAQYGQCTLDGVASEEDILEPGFYPEVGCQFDSLQGFMIYSFGQYRLLPRGPEDADPVAGTPCGIEAEVVTVEELQTDPIGLTCTDAQFVTIKSLVSLEGLVVTTPVYETTSIWGVHASDGSQAANSALLLAFPKSDFTSAPALVEGSAIDVVGKAQEFFCMTEVLVGSYVDQGTVTPIAPLAVDEATLVGSLEDYEGVLVTLSDVEVATIDTTAATFTSVGGLMVATPFYVMTPPTVGTSLVTLTGVIRQTSSGTHLSPRSEADLVLP